MTAQSSVNNGRTGGGALTWNAGAGLWITVTTTAGTIQTSPDAITWTNRTVFNDNPALATLSSVVFASDATTTIAVEQMSQLDDIRLLRMGRFVVYNALNFRYWLMVRATRQIFGDTLNAWWFFGRNQRTSTKQHHLSN
jgi:hypothetical protein